MFCRILRSSPLLTAAVGKSIVPGYVAIPVFHTKRSSSSENNDKQKFSNGFYLGLAGLTVAVGTLGYGLNNYLRNVRRDEENGEISETQQISGEQVDVDNAELSLVTRGPPSSNMCASHVPYVLVGAGTASFSALRAIIGCDPQAKILMIGDESYIPYMRPPLSKEIWLSSDDDKSVKQLKFKQWSGRKRSLFYEPSVFFLDPCELNRKENGGSALLKDRKVIHLDIKKRQVFLDNGWEIGFDKCLIATGVRPTKIPLLDHLESTNRIIYYKTIDDLKYLSSVVDGASKIAILGGGFLGSELACSLGIRSRRKGGPEIVQIFPETGPLKNVLPEYLSKWCVRKVCNEGVEVRTETSLVSASLTPDEKIALKLSDDALVEADYIIVATGSQPNVEMLENSGLEIDPIYGGVHVNAELQACTDIYAAGDVASFYDSNLGRRRVEHHDHAAVSGRIAGANMAGAGKIYSHQSMFWSDLGPEVGFEAVGTVDSSLPTFGVFTKRVEDSTDVTTKDKINEVEEMSSSNVIEVTVITPNDTLDNEKYDKGVVFYLKDGIIKGVLLWNLFNRASIARKIIKDGMRHGDLGEVAKLFSIHKSDDDDE